VVDDSVVVRRTVANVLDGADDVEVVGTASDGRMGLRKIAELKPDVVTLDVEMPGMNGLETLREIRREHPQLPVIMYSTLTERGAEATLEALSLGAVDYATKPSGAATREAAADQVRSNLLPLVQLWGRRTLVRRPLAGLVPNPGAVERRATITSAPRAFAAPAPASGPLAHPLPADGPIRLSTAPPPTAIDLLLIGVSTGGPDALAHLLPSLPAGLPVPIAIVQHMPPVFTTMLAKRLDGASSIGVCEAESGVEMRAGQAYLAPGGRHLEVDATRTGFRTRLTDAPAENSCRPAVDVLFRSAAAAAHGRVLALVLTGMGQDGLLGARAVRDAGGSVLAQDEASSVVWGMPGFVARDGIASAVLPLEAVAGRIVQLVAAHTRQAVSR